MFRTHAKNEAVSAVVALLLKKCPVAQRSALAAVLGAPNRPDLANSAVRAGLLLSERVVNLPLQLVPLLHRCLAEDIEWAAKSAEREAAREGFDFTHFVRLSLADTAADGSTFFARFEDEIFYEEGGGKASELAEKDNFTFRFGIAPLKAVKKECRGAAARVCIVQVLERKSLRRAVDSIAAMVE